MSLTYNEIEIGKQYVLLSEFNGSVGGTVVYRPSRPPSSSVNLRELHIYFADFDNNIGTPVGNEGVNRIALLDTDEFEELL